MIAFPLAQVRAQGSLDAPLVAPNESESDGHSAIRDHKEHWASKITGLWFGRKAPDHARSHETVLQAFRETVAASATSTVRVWCNGRQVALGAIIDPAGYIATKASELSSEVICELQDGSRHSARVVGTDYGSDLAVLKIAAEDLPAIVWSDRDLPAVGGWVVTPGVSDMPVAIGIVSVEPHHVRGGVLGIQMTEDDPGPRITFVVPGSGAAVAGLATGDIITHVNDQPIASADDMVATTSSKLPGEMLVLRILRNGETRRMNATLGSAADTLTSRRARFQHRLGGPLSKRRVLFPLALEHDSVLAPNQCGGVLVNLDGQAIGINIARASRISSFTIPAHVALPILESLKSSAAEDATSPITAQQPDEELTATATER